MKFERSSGILLHISSLPGEYGIGDLGPSAHQFLDFLKKSGHKHWQLLPLNPTDVIYSHSPYSSHSAFAGNPLLISPELLEQEGYVDLKKFKRPQEIEEEKVIFDAVEDYKEVLFEAAFQQFKSRSAKPKEFVKFEKEHEAWLDNYCLYLALRNKYKKANWVDWPKEHRDRDPEALKAAKKEMATYIEKQKFIQFLFFSQWSQLSKAAHEKEISFIGDVPFYVNHDSADCWANPEYFKLDARKQPTHISGVPPDMFSETGQLWGTPVYDWKELKKDNYAWWIARLQQNLLLFDVVRIDHFRAFAAYWEVPASEKTAINGKWAKTPGMDFFRLLKQEYPGMPFIAEDLGVLDQPVYDLLEEFNFPGMKILQFAFGDENRENPYLPYNHLPHTLVYTGTHDNNTTRGWFKNGGAEVKEHLEDFLGQKVSSKNVHEVLHRMALQSVANVAIIPLQDIIGLGEEAIMNVPGSTKGNWTWRVTEKQMPFARAAELKVLNELYGRTEIAQEKLNS